MPSVLLTRNSHVSNLSLWPGAVAAVAQRHIATRRLSAINVPDTYRSSKNLSLDADAIKLDDTKNCRAPKKKMAPQLTEDDIGDLLYFSRAGEQQDLEQLVTSLSAGQGVSAAEILTLARDEGKSTCLHMATGNGQLGMEGGAAISVMGSFIDTMPCQTL